MSGPPEALRKSTRRHADTWVRSYGLTQESLLRAIACTGDANRRASRVPQVTCSVAGLADPRRCAGILSSPLAGIDSYNPTFVTNWISHYLVDAEIGRGGMGVVNSAHDTRLRRVVAKKMLPRGPQPIRIGLVEGPIHRQIILPDAEKGRSASWRSTECRSPRQVSETIGEAI